MLPYINILGRDIPMYGICLAAGFLLCAAISFVRAGRRGYERLNLIIIAACVLGFAMVGGCLMFVFVTYSPAQIIEFIRHGEWDELFGGIVFYGGLIGGVIGGIVGAKIAKDDIRNYFDVIVPVIPLGHAIGRVGCLCAGCCYGRPTESTIGVIYTHPIGGAPTGIPLLPVQLFETGANLIIFVILMLVSRKTKSRYLTTFLYCILYGIVRFILEFFRYDSIRGIAGGLSTSQWISLGLIAGGIICQIAYSAYMKRRS